MGLPVRPAKATQPNSVPVRTPMSRMGEICATSDGFIDTKAPDEKPYSTQNTMMGALAADGSHSASTITAEKAVVRIITLKRPILSASMPGRDAPEDPVWDSC